MDKNEFRNKIMNNTNNINNDKSIRKKKLQLISGS